MGLPLPALPSVNGVEVTAARFNRPAARTNAASDVLTEPVKRAGRGKTKLYTEINVNIYRNDPSPSLPVALFHIDGTSAVTVCQAPSGGFQR